MTACRNEARRRRALASKFYWSAFLQPRDPSKFRNGLCP